MWYIYLMSLCISILYGTSVSAFNWSNYTNAQLLTMKEKAAAAGRTDYIQQLQAELSKRGVVATITLAQAPEGKEWVLQDKNIAVEKKSGGPSLPPPGAGKGQWLFADPQWLYLEQSTGNIIDNAGLLVGKIGAIESTVPDISTALADSTEREARLRKELEETKIKEHAAQEQISSVKTRVKELESKITDLQQKGAGPSKQSMQQEDVTMPELSDVSKVLAGGMIEEVASPAPDFGAFPEAPEAPAAPDFDIPSAPDAPEFSGSVPSSTPQKKEEEQKIEFILSKHEYEELRKDPDKQRASDTLFKSIMKQCRSTFPQADLDVNEYYKAYIAIIHNAFKVLDTNKVFCKYNELNFDSCQKDIKKRKDIDFKEGENCYKRAQFDVRVCVKRLPNKKRKEEEKDVQGKSFQGIDLDAFNDMQQDYFTVWMHHCNSCLFDTTPDAAFEDDVRWVIAYVVAAGRSDVNNPSIIAKSDSDDAIVTLFGLPDQGADPEATFSTWLVGLRGLLTNALFVKPQGLMISYVSQINEADQKKAFLSALSLPPIMKLFTEPLDGTSPLVQKKVTQSIAFYLTFDEQYTLPQLIHTMVPTLAHLEIKKPEIVGTQPAVQSLSDVFSASFTSKSLAELIAIFEKYQKKAPHIDLAKAITLLTSTPYKAQEIIEALKRAGLPQERLEELNHILTVRDAKMLLFLQLFHKNLAYYRKHVMIYDPGTQKIKEDNNLKVGNRLYHESEQAGALSDDLKTTFLRFDREPHLVYEQVVKFLASLGNLKAKEITGEIFSAIIEPYGTLLGVVQQFIKDHNLAMLKMSVTALQLGVLKEAQESYPPIIRKNTEIITVKQLYKDRLGALMQALEQDRFIAFNTALTSFVSQAGTIDSTSLYQDFIRNLKKAELETFLTVMKTRIEELNNGNYTLLKGFELTTPAQQKQNKRYVGAIMTKLHPLLTLFEDVATFSLQEYEKTYKELLQSKDFFKKVPKERLDEFQESLRTLFDEMAIEYSSLRQAL